LTLLAFALRVYHLDAMSFWSDEGISVIRARADVPMLLTNLPVEHNPLYFVGLHYWMRLAGEGDFAVRFFSLFFGVLLIPIVYKLGIAICALPRTSDGQTHSLFAIRHPSITLRTSSPFAIGLLAALLAAINPLQIWYAQEARMYSLVVVLCAGAAWCLVSGWQIANSKWQMADGHSPFAIRHSPSFDYAQDKFAIRYWLSFALLSIAALYTHFFAALVVGALGLWVLFVVISHWRLVISHWKSLRPLLAAFIVTTVLLLPWFPRAVASLSFPGWQEAADPLSLPLRYWLAYTVGNTMTEEYRWLSLGFLLLFILGCFVLLHRSMARAQLLMTNYSLPLFYVFIPFCVMLLLALRKPGYHERYLIVVTPMLFVIWAAALVGILDAAKWRFSLSEWILDTPFARRHLPLVTRLTFYFLLFSLLCASALSVNNLYFDPRYGKPDFRSAAQYIDRHSREGDGLIFDGPDPNKAFYRYFSRQRVTAFDETDFNTRDPEAAAHFLSAHTPRHERWWVVLYFHPPGPTEDWLARNGYQTSSRWFNGIRILLYATPNEATFAALKPQTPHTLATQIPLRIAEVRLPSRLQAGDVLPLVVHWQVDDALPADYQISLRLVNSDGKTIKQLDRRPLDGRVPTSQWQVGETIADRYGLLTPSDAPAGTYHVDMIMYMLNSGAVVWQARSGAVDIHH
jgi:uncharacterized membrane protein